MIAFQKNIIEKIFGEIMKIDAGIISTDEREAGVSAKALEEAGNDSAFKY